MNYSFRRGDICTFYDEPPRAGTYVKHGQRPVIIVSDDRSNLASQTCLIVPLTSKVNKVMFLGQFDIVLNGQVSRVCCNQLRVADKTALSAPYAHINRDIEDALEGALTEALGFNGKTALATIK